MVQNTDELGLRMRAAALSRFILVAGALALTAAGDAEAQVQATKQNTLRWIRGVCQGSLTDIGRAAIAERGKTVAEVCDCTAENMWRKFPSTYYWVQETNPYEWNKVKAEFPKALSACIVE